MSPTDAPTTSPTSSSLTSSEPTDSTCSDDPPDWYDSDGPFYDCDWYGSEASYCQSYGNSFRNPLKGDKTAKKACCICGGGTRSKTCVDMVPAEDGVEEWHDSGGELYNCGEIPSHLKSLLPT